MIKDYDLDLFLTAAAISEYFLIVKFQDFLGSSNKRCAYSIEGLEPHFIVMSELALISLSVVVG